jgi:hypothetical protein
MTGEHFGIERGVGRRQAGRFELRTRLSVLARSASRT